MASFFDVFKVFRPRKTIFSDDFNSLQNSLVASFDLIGQQAPTNKEGVSTAFWCGTPVEGNHAVTLTYYTDNVQALVTDALVPEQAQAQASADAAAVSAAEALVSKDQASAIRFADANALTFFFGSS